MNSYPKTSHASGTLNGHPSPLSREIDPRNVLSTPQPNDSSEQQHRVFFFFPKRWKRGIANLVTACCLAAGGTLLLSQLGYPSNLIVQMSILGTGLWGGAIYLLSQAVGDLGGYLRLDSEGVHVRQRFSTKGIPWDRVKSWNLSGAAQPYEINRMLQVNSTENEPPLVIHCENFRPDALPVLQKMLLFYAPCK